MLELARVLGALLLSALVTWLSIRYARRRKLFDLPGQRRSHTAPTPRGGGIGIVSAVLAWACLPVIAVGDTNARSLQIAAAFALILVAGIGWIDDHRPLSARVRLLVHFIAALTLLLLPIALSVHSECVPSALCLPTSWLAFGSVLAVPVVAALAIVWSINLHNFMDGSNGLLASQALFVFIALAIVSAHAGYAADAATLFVFAAAVLGFLPFNFPRAHVFMGDIGSGSLGLLVAVAFLLSLHGARPALTSAVVASSAFVTDATCTLLWRMLRGRRWYSAHREHLYQWLIRSGTSHARVVAWYMGWNLCVVAPVLAWLNRSAPIVAIDEATALSALQLDLVTPLLLYAVSILVWVLARRWCLHRARTNRIDHAAT